MTKKLLLADDSITIQKVIGIIFATEDYQLLVTDNGDDAFEQALQEVPDLIIADVAMPGKDGFELCQAIKSEPRFGNTSVLLLPGTFEHFDEEKAQSVGADGWITKPFESQALLDKVAQLLLADPAHLMTSAESVDLVEESVDLVEESVDLVEESVDLVEEPVEEPTQDLVEDEKDAVLDEASLGLDQVDSPAPEMEAAEESTEDIWDAVSFEDDELRDQAADDIELIESVEEESSADVAMEFAQDAPAEIENESDDSDSIDFSIDDGSAGVTETRVEETPEFATADVSTDEEESAEIVELTEEATDEATPELAVEESFEVDEGAEPFSSEEDHAETASLVEESVDLSETDIESVDTSLEFVESTESDVEVVADVPLVEPLDEGTLADDDEILDLSEEDVLEEEPLPETEDVFAVEENAGLAGGLTDEPQLEEDEAFTFDESAGLSEEIDEEADDSQFDPDEIAIDENAGLTDDEVEEDSFVLADSEDSDEMLSSVDEMVDSEESLYVADDDLVEDNEDFVATTEIAVDTEVEEDSEFFFDESAAEIDEQQVARKQAAAAAAVAASLAGGATAATTSGIPTGATIEQVEQQLRQLSADDLGEVVAKVAGPIVEKLANEMLEQIAWEVVPDLAETMIRAEIRKIQQGTK